MSDINNPSKEASLICSVQRSGAESDASRAIHNESQILTCADLAEHSAPSLLVLSENSTKCANAISERRCGCKFTHEAASRFFSAEACLFNLRSTRDRHRPLLALGSTACRLSDGLLIEPDECFFEVCTPRSRRCANVVVEVGHTQSLCGMHDRAVRYLTQTDEVMVVVVVKIYGQPNDGTMAIVAYHRDKEREKGTVPVEAVSFGPRAMTTEQVQQLRAITQVSKHDLRGFFAENPRQNTLCVERGVCTYALSLPRHLVLAEDCESGAIGDEFAGVGDWTIDLYELQQAIVKALMRDVNPFA